jgi:N-acetylneuraminic acid mutarotase
LNGKIYAFGGQHGHDPKPVDVDSCHVFDPATGQWSAIAKLPIKRSHFESSTIIHDGRIIIVGGRSNSSTPPRSAVNDVTEYDPATDSWRELGSIPQNLAAPAATIFGDKIIVSCGGLNGTSHPQSTTIVSSLPADLLKRKP